MHFTDTNDCCHFWEMEGISRTTFFFVKTIWLGKKILNYTCIISPALNPKATSVVILKTLMPSLRNGEDISSNFFFRFFAKKYIISSKRVILITHRVSQASFYLLEPTVDLKLCWVCYKLITFYILLETLKLYEFYLTGINGCCHLWEMVKIFRPTLRLPIRRWAKSQTLLAQQCLVRRQILQKEKSSQRFMVAPDMDLQGVKKTRIRVALHIGKHSFFKIIHH